MSPLPRIAAALAVLIALGGCSMNQVDRTDRVDIVAVMQGMIADVDVAVAAVDGIRLTTRQIGGPVYCEGPREGPDQLVRGRLFLTGRAEGPSIDADRVLAQFTAGLGQQAVQAERVDSPSPTLAVLRGQHPDDVYVVSFIIDTDIAAITIEAHARCSPLPPDAELIEDIISGFDERVDPGGDRFQGR